MDGEVRDGVPRENVFKLDVAYSPLATCSTPLVLLAAFVTCLAILLSGALGFVLGLQSGGKGKSRPQLGRQSDSEVQDLSANVLNPRLSTVETLKPPTGLSHLRDLDSARQLNAGQENRPAQPPASMGPIAEGVEDRVVRRPVDVDALQAVYANYISRWQDNAVPWGEPTAGYESQMQSRIASFTSEASELLWQSSLNPEAPQRDLNELDKSLSFGSQLRVSDWKIEGTQIKYCLTPSGKRRELGDSDPGSRIKEYKATLDGNTDVVVKAITVAKGAIPEEKVQEFARQQMALNGISQLLHFYGVCREVDDEEEEETILLVYEYIMGGNMRASAKRSPQDLSWYRYGKVVARDVAQGLAHLHRRGLEHRSLKSTRVMVRASDRCAKLADAGLQSLTRYAGDSRVRRVSNTVDWAAPELLLGQKCGPKADIYSFGVLLWELVTQEMPIRGAQRDPRVPQECPCAVKALIERCMAGAPEARPTAQEVVQTIQRVWNVTADGRSVRTGPYPSSVPPSAVTLPSAFAQARESAAAAVRPDSRDIRDSVTEMVDIRRGVPVRRGTIQSVQSAGGARSPSRSPVSPHGRFGKPPPSPHSSPEARRRFPAASQRNPAARGSLLPAVESDLAARLQLEKLERERKRRSSGLQGTHSAPGKVHTAPSSGPPSEERQLKAREPSKPAEVVAVQKATAEAVALPAATGAEIEESHAQAESCKSMTFTTSNERSDSVLPGQPEQEAMRLEAAAAVAEARQAEKEAAALPPPDEEKALAPAEALQPQSQHMQETPPSRCDRWRQKRDVSLQNWLGHEGTPPTTPTAEDSSKKGAPLTGRRSSLPRLANFLRPYSS